MSGNVLFTHVFGMFRIARCRKKITINVPLPTTPTTNIMLKINGTIYVSGRSLYGLYSSQSGSSSVQPLACWPVASDGSNVTLLAINDGMPIFRDFPWFFHNPVYYRFSCCFRDYFEHKRCLWYRCLEIVLNLIFVQFFTLCSLNAWRRDIRY